MGVEMGLASQPESELKEGEVGGREGLCTISLTLHLYDLL